MVLFAGCAHCGPCYARLSGDCLWAQDPGAGGRSSSLIYKDFSDPRSSRRNLLLASIARAIDGLNLLCDGLDGNFPVWKRSEI